MAGLVEGLGFEEVNQSVTSTAIISGTDVYAAGSVTAPIGDITTLTTTTANLTTTIGTTVSGVTGRFSNDVTIGSSVIMGATVNEGVMVTNIVAEAIITGGMWVEVSGASGTAAALVAKGTENPQPLGIAMATVASGTAVNILTRGVYTGIIAEATVNAGDGFAVGAGNALNCAKATGAGVNRGTVLMGAGSEGVISVYLF